MTKKKDLADKIDLHLQVNSPGFHLSDDDMRLIAASLRGGEVPQSPRNHSIELAHPERLKALSDAADYVEKIGARYHSGRDIANGIRCLGPQSPDSRPDRKCK